MRISFRDFAVVSSAVSLIFFCSCERHHPEELPAEHAAAPEHGEKQPGPAEAAPGEHPAAPATAVVPIPTSPAPTPAEFFPSATPH